MSATQGIPGSCFIAGTSVHTEAGLENIEDISVGTKVWSFDHDRNAWLLMAVLEVKAHDFVGAMVTIKARESTVEVTNTHPFWVVSGASLSNRPFARNLGGAARPARDKSRWVLAEDLRPGDKFLTHTGRVVSVSSVRVVRKTNRVFNISVDRLHNYAVGGAGILVHNK